MNVSSRPGAGGPDAHPVFVSRQSIFGVDLEIYGYELFFRAGVRPGRFDPSHAAEDLGRSLIDFVNCDLNRAVGPHRAFVNLTQRFILDGYCELLPKGRVVLEVLEDVRPDPAVLRELGRLSRLGYRIALDDFVYSAGQVPLVRLADIVKIDVLATERAGLGALMATLRQSDVRLLAEKIETGDDLRFCRDLGFDYFQGFALSRPTPSPPGAALGKFPTPLLGQEGCLSEAKAGWSGMEEAGSRTTSSAPPAQLPLTEEGTWNMLFSPGCGGC